jgi:hypothetical protein
MLPQVTERYKYGLYEQCYVPENHEPMYHRALQLVREYRVDEAANPPTPRTGNTADTRVKISA